MNSGNIMAFIDILIAACGVYMIYASFKLKNKKIIDDKFLLPKGVEQSMCTDVDGYVAFMFPKFLLSAVVILIGAVFGVLNDFGVIALGNLYYIIFILVLVAMGYLMVTSTKALNKFFPHAAK